MKKPCPCPEVARCLLGGWPWEQTMTADSESVTAGMQGHLQGRMAALLLYQGPTYVGCVPTAP